MKVHDVRFFLPEDAPQIFNAVASPGRTQPELQFGKQVLVGNFIVSTRVLQDAVPGLAHDGTFCQEFDVLTASLPVIVVTN